MNGSVVFNFENKFDLFGTVQAFAPYICIMDDEDEMKRNNITITTEGEGFAFYISYHSDLYTCIRCVVHFMKNVYSTAAGAAPNMRHSIVFVNDSTCLVQ